MFWIGVWVFIMICFLFGWKKLSDRNAEADRLLHQAHHDRERRKTRKYKTTAGKYYRKS